MGTRPAIDQPPRAILPPGEGKAQPLTVHGACGHHQLLPRPSRDPARKAQAVARKLGQRRIGKARRRARHRATDRPAAPALQRGGKPRARVNRADTAHRPAPRPRLARQRKSATGRIATQHHRRRQARPSDPHIIAADMRPRKDQRRMRAAIDQLRVNRGIAREQLLCRQINRHRPARAQTLRATMCHNARQRRRRRANMACARLPIHAQRRQRPIEHSMEFAAIKPARLADRQAVSGFERQRHMVKRGRIQHRTARNAQAPACARQPQPTAERAFGQMPPAPYADHRPHQIAAGIAQQAGRPHLPRQPQLAVRLCQQQRCAAVAISIGQQRAGPVGPIAPPADPQPPTDLGPRERSQHAACRRIIVQSEVKAVCTLIDIEQRIELVRAAQPPTQLHMCAMARNIDAGHKINAALRAIAQRRARDHHPLDRQLVDPHVIAWQQRRIGIARPQMRLAQHNRTARHDLANVDFAIKQRHRPPIQLDLADAHKHAPVIAQCHIFEPPQPIDRTVDPPDLQRHAMADIGAFEYLDQQAVADRGVQHPRPQRHQRQQAYRQNQRIFQRRAPP